MKVCFTDTQQCKLVVTHSMIKDSTCDCLDDRNKLHQSTHTQGKALSKNLRFHRTKFAQYWTWYQSRLSISAQHALAVHISQRDYLKTMILPTLSILHFNRWDLCMNISKIEGCLIQYNKNFSTVGVSES